MVLIHIFFRLGDYFNLLTKLMPTCNLTLEWTESKKSNLQINVPSPSLVNLIWQLRAIQFYSKDLLNALLSRTVYLSLHIFARPMLILFIFVSHIILFPQDIISPQSLSLLHSCYLKTRLERGLTFLVLKSEYNPKYKQGSNNWQTITTRTFWDKGCFFFYT